MAKIPEFLLKALYVRHSLRRTDDGFGFQLKNDMGPARIVGALPPKLDHKPLPLADCSFVYGGEEVAFETVTADASVMMRKGEAVTVRIRGPALRPGRHTLDIGVPVKDLGELTLTISDAAHQPPVSATRHLISKYRRGSHAPRLER